MYLSVSARLAQAYPELCGVIVIVDAAVAESGATAALRADVVASKARASESQVRSVLDLYVKEEWMVWTSVLRCANPQCDQSLLPESEEGECCTQCGAALISDSMTEVCRLSGRGVAMHASEFGSLGFALPSDLASYHGKIDVVVITVKREEFDAVLKRFPVEATVYGRRNYNISRLPRSRNRRSLIVASVRANSQGSGEAQAVTRDAIDDLDPATIFIVGIAGAPPGDVTLGDVVFGTHVHDLTVSAIDIQGNRTFALSGGEVVRLLQNEVANLAVGLPAALGEGDPLSGAPDASFPSTGVDDLAQEKLRRTLEDRFRTAGRHIPVFHDGPIASSDTLVKDPELVAIWQATLRNMRAIEMECAGAYRACRTISRHYPLLPIRSISDIVGVPRDEKWTAYACEVAAEYARAVARVLRFDGDK